MTAMWGEAALAFDSEYSRRSTFGRPYAEIDESHGSVGTDLFDTTLRTYMCTSANAMYTNPKVSRRMSCSSRSTKPPYTTASPYLSQWPPEETDVAVSDSLHGKWRRRSSFSSLSGHGSCAHVDVSHAALCCRTRLLAAAERAPAEPPVKPPHKPLARLSQSGSPELQDILQAVAERLCSLPDRRALASWLGQGLDAEERQWLREQGLRLVTVLQHHSDDFFVIQEPNSVTVMYLQKTAKKAFAYADQMFTNVDCISL
eukprot:TRINITY_DN26009_c0_g1_i12.p1 TRINITY_DN26009_c0_g1~~TRINITY_DN26009_c0_g1_i12.p1  ORF type:complete len:258 (+),score=38.76 TRINITY_DN26009_c0_g1_i12:88-861(+)